MSSASSSPYRRPRGGRRRATLCVTAALLASLAAPAAGHAERTRIQLGTAVRWGCLERRYQGPAELACGRLYTPLYEQTLQDRFDVVVPENELKLPWIHPGQRTYDFAAADRLVAWAQANGKHVRGHTLIWGRELPAWMTDPPQRLLWTRETLLAQMRDHITAVVQHFRSRFPGVVSEWDVVNEAFEDDGSYHDNLLLRVIGPDYVEKAFEYARQADPGALLFYNEYNADRPNPRSRAVLDMAADFRRRGIPLDGIGMQMHVATGGRHPSHDQLRGLMRAYADLGLVVELTELDVGTSQTPAPRDPLGDQADVYRSLFGDCRAAPNCTAITVWGAADPYSWRGPGEKALLFDDAFRPKPFVPQLLALLDAAARRSAKDRPARRAARRSRGSRAASSAAGPGTRSARRPRPRFRRRAPGTAQVG